MDDLGEVVNYRPEFEAESSSETAGNAKDSPLFKTPIKEEPLIKHCKTCGDEYGSFNIEGECLSCALKRLRKLETKLAELKQIKNEHEFCCIDGHGEIYKNKLHPEWTGKFVINGIELYPVYPLCKDCLDTITAYLVTFLEERGILRKGSGHDKNQFGEPYSVPMKISEKQEYLARLEEFIRSTATIYSKDIGSPTNLMYDFIKDRQKMLLMKEQKGMQEWQKEREVKLPTNQLEFLKLAEKYYPCLKRDTEEQNQRSKEIEWLKKQPVPEVVINKVVPIVKKAIQGWEKWIVLNKEEQENLEQIKLNRSYLMELLSRKKISKEKLEGMMEFLNNAVSWELGPLADSAEEVVELALQKVTLSSLTLKSTTNESKQDQ